MTRSIFFVANGSQDATLSAYRGGAEIGYEAMNTRPPERIPTNFVDWPFKKLNRRTPTDVFSNYIKTVYQERPELAVIPDLNGDIETEQVFEWAYRINKYCEEIHLLGGSPHKHYELIYEKGLRQVESINTSVPIQSARWGDAWRLKDGEPYWGDGQGGM